MKRARKANLELLRIIAMVMVVTAHLINHGGMITFVAQGTASYYISWTLFGVSFTCINIYLLISGYFLIDAKFSTWKLARMAGQVFFYAFGVTALFWLFGDVEHEFKNMVFSVTPILSDFYWFVSMYVGMYLLSPVMNRLIRALTKRQLECAMALGFVLVSVWPNIFFFSSALNTAGGVSISWFLVVYLFGAYLKLHYVPNGKFGRKLLAGVGAALLIPLSRFVIEWLLKTPLGRIGLLEDLMWGYSVFFSYSSILVSLASLLLFVAFLNLEIKSEWAGKWIVFIASASFGVYLLNDHLYIRETLWAKINGISWLGQWYLLPATVAAVAAVYVGCTLIELLRLRLFAPLDNSEKLKGIFRRLDDRLRARWRGERPQNKISERKEEKV